MTERDQVAITDERISSFVNEAKELGITKQKVIETIESLTFGEDESKVTPSNNAELPVNFNSNLRQRIVSAFDQDMPNVLASDYDLNEVVVDEPQNIVTRSPEANTELGNLIAPVVKADSTSVTSELMSGDNTSLIEAQDVVQAKATERAHSLIEQDLQSAQTPEETIDILKRGQATLKEPVSIATLRENYIAERLNPKPEDLGTISGRIRTAAFIAGEKDKARNKIWEGTTFWEAVADFGEFVTITGIASEERLKYTKTIDSFIDDLVASGDVTKMQEITESMISTWAESETILFGNNNSLMTVDRIDSAKEALLDVGLGLTDGTMSREQSEDIINSVLEATLIGGEVKQLGKGIAGLLKFLAFKIFPQDVRVPKRPSLEGELLPPEEQLRIGSDTPLLDFRDGSKVIDEEYNIKPDNFVVEKQEGVKKLTDSAGLTEEQAFDRMLPNITPDESTGFGNIQDEVTEVSDLILADESAVNMGMKRGRQLETQTGNSLKVVDSGSTLVPNEDPESLGDFVFAFGDSNKKGFKTEQEALDAGQNGFGGTPFKTVQKNGQWYNEVTYTHKFDARKDVTDLGISDFSDFRSSAGEWDFFLRDPARILGTEQLDSLYALKGINRSKVTKQLNKFQNGVKRLSFTQSKQLNQALKYGDDNAVEFGSKAELAGTLGISPNKVSDKVWDSYKNLREIMDDVYTVRNNNYRAVKENKGYKMLRTQEGDDVLVRPISSDDIQGSVLNARTRSPIEGDAGDLVIVKSDSLVKGADGKMYDQLAVMPDDLGSLPVQLLRKRAGHIDRNYRETGYTVQQIGTRTVNDVLKESKPTVGIVKSKKQADELIQSLRVENPDAEFKVLRSRENDELDVIYGDEDSVQFTYSSTHSNKRGDQLRGSDGLEASTLSPLESIQKSVYGLQREYDANIMQSLKARFINQFAPYLQKQGGTPWSRNLADMMSPSKETPTDVHNAAKAWHSYVNTLQTVQRSTVFRALDSWIESMVSKLGIDATVDSAAASAYLQRVTANLIILGRPLYQIPQNLFQATYVAIRHPVSGAKAVAQFPFILPQMAGISKDFKLAAKVLGTDTKTAKELINTIRDSGLWDSVGRMDDILELAGEDLVSSGADWMKFYGNKYGAGTVKAPFNASRTLQENSLRLVNLYTYLSEFNRQVVKGGKPFNAKTKADLSASVQKLTQTQNGMNQFLYQNKGNVSAIAMQFMQHTHKLFLDVVLDPALTAVTGKGVGKQVSPFSDNRSAALLTVGSVFTLFGFNGIFGEHAGQGFADSIRENYPEFSQVPEVKSMMDGGLINTMFNAAFLGGDKGSIDVSAKINPASFVDSVYSHFLSNAGSIDMFGATGSTVGSILDTGKSVIALTTNPVMDTREKALNTAAEIGELVKGVGDAERAFIASNMLQWPYMSSLSGTLRVTEEEGMFALFNVTPTMVADANRQKSFSGTKRDTKDTIELAKVFAKAMNRELAFRKSEGTLTGVQDVNVIIEKYSSMAKAAVEPLAWDEVEQTFRNFQLGLDAPTYQEYIRPYINTETMEEQVQGLQRLLQVASTPEAREEVKAALEAAQAMEKQFNEIYGDK